MQVKIIHEYDVWRIKTRYWWYPFWRYHRMIDTPYLDWARIQEYKTKFEAWTYASKLWPKGMVS